MYEMEHGLKRRIVKDTQGTLLAIRFCLNKPWMSTLWFERRVIAGGSVKAVAVGSVVFTWVKELVINSPKETF